MKKLYFIFLISVILIFYTKEINSFPIKPIKVIVGYEAGSSTDIAARVIFPILERDLGQPIIIINKPGAASSIAMREVYKEKPDGYTWGVSCSVSVFKLLGLMPLDHNDFSILAIPSLGVAAVAVPAKSPFKSIKELVEYAKENPGKLRCSTTSKGAVHWMQAKNFEQAAGVKFNIIPNPGGASFIATQVGGGHVDLGVASMAALRAQRDAGNLRFLAVMAETRVPGFEEIPTLKENGYNATYVSWQCYLAPKGLPSEIYERLKQAFYRTANSQEYRQWCLKNARIPTPEYIGEKAIKFLDEDREVQKPILEEIGAIKK